MSEACPVCDGPIECLGGRSAHPDNWYCEDEEGCGWQAWTSGTYPKIKPTNNRPKQQMSTKTSLLTTPLEISARNSLKVQVAHLNPKEVEQIKIIYGRNTGSRPIKDAKNMPIEEIIDEIPYVSLPILQRQILRTLQNRGGDDE